MDLQADVKSELDKIVVSGTAPFDGTLHLTVCYKRDRFRFRPKRRPKYDPAKFDEYQESYDKTQQMICFEVDQPVPEGAFEIDIKIPEGANGDCLVQGLLLHKDDFAIDSSPIQLKSRK